MNNSAQQLHGIHTGFWLGLQTNEPKRWENLKLRNLKLQFYCTFTQNSRWRLLLYKSFLLTMSADTKLLPYFAE